MNGASGRTKPMKRPTRIVAPPRRSKKPSTCSSRSSVIFSRSPWRSSQPRPSRRPSVYDVEVAGHRARPHDRDQHEQRDLALAGDEAADDHGRLARRDEADERAGLQEREHADEQVGPRPERAAGVLEQLLEVRQLDRRRRRSARRPRRRASRRSAVQRPSLLAAGDQEARPARRAPSSQPHFIARLRGDRARQRGGRARARCSGSSNSRTRSGRSRETIAWSRRRPRTVASSTGSIAGHSERAASWRSLTGGGGSPARACRRGASSSARAAGAAEPVELARRPRAWTARAATGRSRGRTARGRAAARRARRRRSSARGRGASRLGHVGAERDGQLVQQRAGRAAGGAARRAAARRRRRPSRRPCRRRPGCAWRS